MSKALFISRKDIVAKSPISGVVDADKLMQYIEIAQDLNIQPQLGTDLYNKLQSEIIAGTISGDYKTLLDDYVKPMLIHFAASEFLAYASYTIANGGVYKRTSENGETVSKDEIDFLVDKERRTAKFYEDRFNDYMTYNASTKFPEFYTNNNEDLHPMRRTNFTNWSL